MKIKGYHWALCACSTLALMGFSPQEKEEMPPEELREEMRLLEQQEGPRPSSQKSILTTQQQDELKIDEENVFDTTPPG